MALLQIAKKVPRKLTIWTKNVSKAIQKSAQLEKSCHIWSPCSLLPQLHGQVNTNVHFVKVGQKKTVCASSVRVISETALT